MDNSTARAINAAIFGSVRRDFGYALRGKVNPATGKVPTLREVHTQLGEALKVSDALVSASK